MIYFIKPKFKIGDYIVKGSKNMTLDDVFVVQKINDGRKCLFYYTIYRLNGNRNFMSITNVTQDSWEEVSEEFKLEHAEHFI